jgi:hypothetical protein
MDEGAVLLHMKSETYFGLNSVGVRIWSLLADSESLDALVDGLAESYPEVSRDTLHSDASELIEELRSNALLVDRTGESASG